MKVDSTNTNILSATSFQNKPLNKSFKMRQIQNYTFTGNVSQEVLAKEINKFNTPFLKGVNKLRNNISEFQDICINALGTGLLAPLFIKYNFLSKTDEDTRTYSAWRQPVSAVLAVATQGVITIPFVKLVNSMTNSGWFNEKCNLSPFKEEKYVRKTLKKLNPNINKKQLDIKVADYMDNMKKTLLDNLRQENKIYYTYHNEPVAKAMDSKKYKELLVKTIDDILKEETEELNRCKGEKITNRVNRSDFYRTHYEECKNLFKQIEDKINNTNDVKSIDKYLKNLYKQLKSKKADSQFLEIIKEIQAYKIAGKEGYLEKVRKIQDNKHLNGYRNLTSKEEVHAKVLANLQSRIKDQEETIKFIEDVKAAIEQNKSVHDIEEMFTQKVKEYKSKGQIFKLEDKIFAEEVVNKLKALTKSHIDGVKRISTLLVALAMLPVSCSLLNWLYPRFMDAVFPKLSSKKHDNEAKNLIDKANKNGEVK